MKLPRGDEYSMAVQNPNFCFSDSDLKLSTIQTNNLGLPIPYSGGFTTTYKVRNGNFSWAVRCFTREVDHLQKRYQAIDEFIEKTNCDYLVEARYLKHGIQVNNEWSSIIKMHWIEGDLFNVHLSKIVSKKDEVETLLKKFVHLVEKLHRDKISHGDLQHGNIIIRNDKLFLIDYDGMFLPEIAAVGTGEVGHPNYQHPKRSVKNFDGHLDNFSSLVIYTALKAISVKPDLWKKYNNAENLLFKKEDFSDPLNSELFYDLSQIEELKHLANNLIHVCLSDFSKIPSLKDFINDKTEGVKITINSPKLKQAENPNDFFGNLYKNKTVTSGFQYKPTHTLPDPGNTNTQPNFTNTSSGGLPNQAKKKTKGISSQNYKVIGFWAIIIVVLIIIGVNNSSDSTNYSNTSNTNVVNTIPIDTSCSNGVKNSDGVCITRDQNCQNTNGVNSYWDGSYCNCKSGTIWNKSKTKCVTMLGYCQGLNGINATYNESDNTCGCAYGYELNSSGICALPVTLTNDQICARDIPNSYWGGQYGTNGGPICPCSTGYVTSSDGKSCVIAPTLTDDQMCNQKYNNSYSIVDPITDSKSCSCKTGYYWDNNASGQAGNCYTSAELDKSCNNRFPNTHWDKTYGASGKFVCACKASNYSWNSDRTACYDFNRY